MVGNGHRHSFNGDGRMDILARSVSGDLFVVPHSGELRGARTYEAPVKIAENFHHLRDHYVVRTIDIDGSGRAGVLALSFTRYNPVNGIFLYPNLGGINGMNTIGERVHIRANGDPDVYEFGPATPDTPFSADLVEAGDERSVLAARRLTAAFCECRP